MALGMLRVQTVLRPYMNLARRGGRAWSLRLA